MVREFCKSEAGVAAVRRAAGLSGLHGNFGTVYGNFFYIVTDEEELIQRFERLVADNKATQAYQDERKVCFPCSECNQWSAASGLCGLTGRYRQPQWECFARYVLPKGKVEGDGANMRIELPIPEKAGKKAVLIDRGQWEV